MSRSVFERTCFGEYICIVDKFFEKNGWYEIKIIIWHLPQREYLDLECGKHIQEHIRGYVLITSTPNISKNTSISGCEMACACVLKSGCVMWFECDWSGYRFELIIDAYYLSLLHSNSSNNLKSCSCFDMVISWHLKIQQYVPGVILLRES